jgi:hypothetical protein
MTRSCKSRRGPVELSRRTKMTLNILSLFITALVLWKVTPLIPLPLGWRIVLGIFLSEIFITIVFVFTSYFEKEETPR